MMRILNYLLLSILVVSSSAQSYDYQEGGYDQDYSQDNLYHDYAMKQQEKEANAGWVVTRGTVGKWISTRKFEI